MNFPSSNLTDDIEVDLLDECYHQTIQTQLDHLLSSMPKTIGEIATLLHVSKEEIEQVLQQYPNKYEISKPLHKRFGESLVTIKKVSQTTGTLHQ